jgi:sugar (pentulose or hexulose) kinase
VLLPKDYLRLRHHPGDASITFGTSAVVLGVADHLVPGSFCHAQRDQWLRLDSLHAGVKSLEWLRDLLAPGRALRTSLLPPRT